MKARREGELLIDHTQSPGVAPELALRIGLNPTALAGGRKFEAATSLCKHCQRQIIRNPLRLRGRHHCRSCDGYICDDCELERKLSLTCTPFTKKLDLAHERAVRGLSLEGIF